MLAGTDGEKREVAFRPGPVSGLIRKAYLAGPAIVRFKIFYVIFSIWY